MKKSIIILLFCVLSIFSYAKDYVYNQEEYKQKIENNKENIDSIESVDYLEKRIIMNGVVVKGVRVHRIDTNLSVSTSEITLMKDDMINAFMKKNKDIKSIDVILGNDKIITKGSVLLLGMLMQVEMEGMFYINDKSEIIYDIKKAVVNGFIGVPDSILNPFRERINPVFKLDKIGVPLYCRTVVLGKDRIVLR